MLALQVLAQPAAALTKPLNPSTWVRTIGSSTAYMVLDRNLDETRGGQTLLRLLQRSRESTRTLVHQGRGGLGKGLSGSPPEPGTPEQHRGPTLIGEYGLLPGTRKGSGSTRFFGHQVPGKTQRCPRPLGGVAMPVASAQSELLPKRRSLLPRLALCSAREPRGQTGGGRNFPALGLRLPRNSFCLRRERGNGKGGEAVASVRCAAPLPAQTL